MRVSLEITKEQSLKSANNTSLHSCRLCQRIAIIWFLKCLFWMNSENEMNSGLIFRWHHVQFFHERAKMDKVNQWVKRGMGLRNGMLAENHAIFDKYTSTKLCRNIYIPRLVISLYSVGSKWHFQTPDPPRSTFLALLKIEYTFNSKYRHSSIDA